MRWLRGRFALEDVRAGRFDARRTPKLRLRHLKVGGWDYRLGFILGWHR